MRRVLSGDAQALAGRALARGRYGSNMIVSLGFYLVGASIKSPYARTDCCELVNYPLSLTHDILLWLHVAGSKQSKADRSLALSIGLFSFCPARHACNNEIPRFATTKHDQREPCVPNNFRKC